jgi:hypothetical protein
MDLATNWLKLRRVLALILAGGMTSACDTPRPPVNLGGIFNLPTTYAAAAPNEPANPNSGQPIGGAVDRAVLLPGGDYSLTTLRQRPESGQIPKVLCQAPSPDWATAIAMQQQLSASGNFFHGSSGQFAGSNSYSETIAAMAGRTAGVVALRDGLYSACQAYANGVIGKDAYALILSQYGYLLVALAGNSGGAGGGGSSEKSGSSTSPAMPPGVAVAVNTAAAAPTSFSSPQGKPAGGASGPNVTQLAQQQMQIMHALMVTCISAYDNTVRTAGEQANTLLTQKTCRELMDWMKSSTTSILASLAKT